MNTTQKLKSVDSDMTKLKRLWRDQLTENERDHWRARFTSSRAQADLRRELKEVFEINLQQDSQLNRFRQWDVRLLAIEEEKQKSAADQADLEALGLSGEKLRIALIERMKARAYNEGDFKLALKAISADVKAETLLLGRDKFNVASRAKIDLALDQLARHIRNNVEARAAYEAFCKLVKDSAQ